MGEPGMELENNWNVITDHFDYCGCDDCGWKSRIQMQDNFYWI